MEGKSVPYYVGMCVGIFVAVLLLTLLRKRRGGATYEYDERQNLMRGKAYGMAFLVLLCYLTLNAAVCALWRSWTEPGLDGLLGVLLAVGVFLVQAIHYDAYFSLRENPRTFRRICLIVILCQLPSIVMTFREAEESFLTDGRLNGNVLPIASSLVFGAAYVSLLLHERHSGEDRDGEDA